ncbi:helix-turn-helix domain-containing protein [Tateyamaria sp. ANG-S1]|uniref:helix-turn-helix domain-containing protein n=1 Tax=Tateyamaria sp. ANG-S1 TaxID=1577905 RepID=UPI00058077FD|nr:helix-turn-helix domain-containing protein [Tateyamaria sp. ANG-S1]KIC45474.1 excisionase [Tateyamaria sp. ANG-S1]
MAAPSKEAFFDRLPDEVEIKNAEQLRTIVASQMKEGAPTTLSLALEGGDVQTVTLAPALAASLLEVLRLVSSGRGFRMIPVGSELTTQQAADLLNVSRPFLVKLLEEGDIPFAKTGRHRRVRAEDLFAYKEKRDAARSDALSDLARMDAEDGMV